MRLSDAVLVAYLLYDVSDEGHQGGLLVFNEEWTYIYGCWWAVLGCFETREMRINRDSRLCSVPEELYFPQECSKLQLFEDRDGDEYCENIT